MFSQDRLIYSLNSTNYCRNIGSITFEDLFTFDALYVSAVRCSHGFMHKKDTQKFMSSVHVNTYKLFNEIKQGKFKPTYYSKVTLLERGKKRVVKPPTFKCKIVQKCICDYLIRPILEPKMINSVYSSIRGRGLEQMQQKIFDSLQSLKGYSIVCCDFSKYFDNISTSKLMNMFERYIEDKNILNFISLFFPGDYGLSLGNEISQLPASFYPSSIDHAIKDKLGIKHYYRFMDDTLAIIPKDQVAEYINTLKEEAAKLEIKINDKKLKVYNYGNNFIFCKKKFIYNGKRYYRLINPQRESNEKRKLRGMVKNNRDVKKIENQYKSVIGGLKKHPNTYKMRKRLDTYYKEIVYA